MGNTAVRDKDRLGEDGGPTMDVDYDDVLDDSTEFTPGTFRNLRRSSDCEEPMGRLRASTITSGSDITDKKLPTVFRWEGGGKNVCMAGSFDNWKSRIPLVKSQGDFYIIVNLPEGTHQYKFFVDGQWQIDANLPKGTDENNGEHNLLTVSKTDYEVFEALAMDSAQADSKEIGRPGTPPGEYVQEIPAKNLGGIGFHSGPPILPPHLLQVILNKETPTHCEPTLLPEPNHVMLNHLYALSIKDGVMVLSSTHRYRKKYVTTLLYKPI